MNQLRLEFYPHSNAEFPELPENWNEGFFQLGMIRCANCEEHNTTNWHEEIEFVEKFNEIGHIIKNEFPNVIIVGNEVKPKKYE